MVKRQLLAVLCAALVAGVPLHSVQAGGPLGGALEVTQLANNAELMAQVSESMQQTVQQINMLTTMLQNLKSLANLSEIAQALGIPTNNLDNFIKSYKTTDGAIKALNDMKTVMDRFGRNAESTASFYETLINDLEDVLGNKKKLTPEELRQAMNRMPQERRIRAQQVLARRLQVLESMQNDYKYIQDNASQIGSITGNLQGLQFIASQQSGLQRIMLDTQMAIQQMALDMQAERVENAEAAKIEAIKSRILFKDAFQRNAF